MASIYSNPRLNVTVPDWPLGGNKRGPAVFSVEAKPGKGERVVRVTTGKPKASTYARKARIVDGDDGRTYVALLTMYGFVSVMRGDMQLQAESIFDRDPRYADVLSLFD